jgi:hypothetical protein
VFLWQAETIAEQNRTARLNVMETAQLLVQSIQSAVKPPPGFAHAISHPSNTSEPPTSVLIDTVLKPSGAIITFHKKFWSLLAFFGVLEDLPHKFSSFPSLSLSTCLYPAK